MNSNLSHLTSEELYELIKRYYNNEKITDLKREYNFTLSSNQLVRFFPPEVFDIKCKYCDTNLTRSRRPRDYSYSNRIAPSCPECGHEDSFSCKCSNCLKAEIRKIEKLRLEKKEKLNLLLQIDTERSINIEELNFIQKIYLGAFLREGISEDFTLIKAVTAFINPLAPTDEFQSEILNTLIDNRIIVIHPDSDPNHFQTYYLGSDGMGYFRNKVNWYLNVKKDGMDRISLIESIIAPGVLKEDDYEDAFQLWKKIALYESLEYFKYHVYNVFSVDYKIGTKTISVIGDLLNDFSVSQIYGIIYYSINRALRFQAENDHVLKSHAANTIIGHAQSYGERALAKKYTMNKYNRIKECPESALSKFFFERVLKISYDGFNEKPYKFVKDEIS
jgi:hypothetical protein